MKRNKLTASLLLAPLCLAPYLIAGEGENDRNRDREDATVSNVVYVNTNNPAGSAVLAYRRNAATGLLSEISGSPFSTGGTGYANVSEVLGPDDHDQELVLTADNRFLYVVNQGSNTIAAFRVHPDGSLTPVAGSPFPSGGIQPASLGFSGEAKLFVVNRGDQGPGGTGGTHVPNYAGFLILPNGALVQIPWSKLSMVAGSSPTQALVTPNGKLMFDSHLFETPFNNANFPPFIPAESSVLHSYKINLTGQLVPVATVIPPAPIPPFILGLQLHPTAKILYAGYVVAGVLAAYAYDDDGHLTLTGTAAGSPNPPNPNVPPNGMCWIATSPDGKYAYTSGAINDHIDVFSLADPAHPQYHSTVELGGPKSLVNFPVDATFFDTTPFQLHTSPDGKFLYVLNHEATVANTAPSGNALHILKVNANGTLTELPTSPLIFPHSEVPVTAHPLGIAVL